MPAIFSQNREERRVKKAIERINSIQPWFAKQQRFLEDDSRYVWQIAASQSGKTQVAVPKFLRRILAKQMELRKKHGRWVEAPYWIVVPNSKVAIPVKKKVKDYLPYKSGLIDREAQGQSRAFWSSNDGTGTAYMKYGAMIRYMSFAQGEGLVAESVYGHWVDECARCDDEAIWENLFARLKETKGWLIGTSSPASRNAFYTKIYKKYQDDPEHSWLKWTSYDSARSPYSAVTMADVEKAKAIKSPHLFAREYMADWSSAEGMIYAAFDYKRNVVSSFPFAHEKRFFMGIDVGFSHPTVIVTCSESKTASGKRIFVEDERVIEMTAPSDIVMMAADEYRRYQPFDICYDYGGGGAFFPMEWEKYWLNEYRSGKCTKEYADKAILAVDKAYKGPRSVNDGIALVNGIIGNPSKPLLIGDKCKRILDEIDGYVWQDHESEDKPVKENDDALDALRYAISNYVWQHMDAADEESLFGFAVAA